MQGFATLILVMKKLLYILQFLQIKHETIQ
jgi:hypothetical protein